MTGFRKRAALPSVGAAWQDAPDLMCSSGLPSPNLTSKDLV